MNEAKRKAIVALESDCARACRDFVEQWPDDLATVADLRAFIGDDAPASSAAMRHEIERAGMTTAKKVRINGRSETVLIVRGALTVDDIAAASPTNVVNAIVTAQTAFRG